MVETVAHLVDHVFPVVPVRQWVVSLPKRLRYFLVRDARLLNRVVRIALSEMERAIRAHSPGVPGESGSGGVVFIHRFGSALNPPSCLSDRRADRPYDRGSNLPPGAIR